MSHGSVAIDKDRNITITPASMGAEMQSDLIVLLGVAERMSAARNQKMLYGIVTQVEFATIERVVQFFARATQHKVNEETMKATDEERERAIAIRERAAALEARKKKEGTALRRQGARNGGTNG